MSSFLQGIGINEGSSIWESIMSSYENKSIFNTDKLKNNINTVMNAPNSRD